MTYHCDCPPFNQSKKQGSVYKKHKTDNKEAAIMAKKFHKMLSVMLAFVMVLSLCTPFMDVFAASEELTEVKQWNLVLGDETQTCRVAADDREVCTERTHGTTHRDITRSAKEIGAIYDGVVEIWVLCHCRESECRQDNKYFSLHIILFGFGL